MTNNTKLIEQFSQLEKLCNDIYGDKHGVTIYINEMKGYPLSSVRNIPRWKNDLEKLIEVRDKRNKLSHGEVSFDSDYTTEEDILFVKNFRRRILKQTDPLAMLNKAHSSRSVTEVQKSDNEEGTNLGFVFLMLFAAIIIILLLFKIYTM